MKNVEKNTTIPISVGMSPNEITIPAVHAIPFPPLNLR